MPNNDLISRKALLERFEELKENPNNKLIDTVFLDGAQSVIDAAPAVDAVEVVRCKDCVHYHDDLCGKIQWIMDGYYSGTFERKQPLDFCSQAEKKGQST